MKQFVKGFITFIKREYGYLAQRFTKEELSKVSKGVQDKQSDTVVPCMPNKQDINYEKTYIFPNYEAFEKSCYAFIAEEKERERHTNKYPKRTIKRKTDGKVRTLRKQKGD